MFLSQDLLAYSFSDRIRDTDKSAKKPDYQGLVTHRKSTTAEG